MKILACLFCVLTAVSGFSGTEVFGDFEIFLGSYEQDKSETVVALIPEGKLTPSYGPSVIKEIKDTFNLENLELLSAPRITTLVGEEDAVMTQNVNKPVGNYRMGFKVLSLMNNMAHVSVTYSIKGGKPVGADFTTRLNNPVTLASRINGHFLFIVCTVTTPGESDNTTPPRILNKVNPIYPETMKKAKIMDTVVLRVTVGSDGKTKACEVLEGQYPALNQAAIEAVKQWTWEPGTVHNRPVEMNHIITTQFRLQ